MMQQVFNRDGNRFLEVVMVVREEDRRLWKEEMVDVVIQVARQ